MATVEELVKKHARKVLEKIASKHGIDATDTKEYPDKTKIAEAILMTGAPVEEKPHKPRIGKKGVLAKRAMMMEAAKKMLNEGARALEAGVEDIRSGIRDMQSAMKAKAGKIAEGAIEVQKGIGAQARKNAEFAKAMKAKVGKMHSGIKEVQAEIIEGAKRVVEGMKEVQKGIQRQAKENSEYIRDFYYG